MPIDVAKDHLQQMSAERTDHSTRIGDQVEPVWQLPGVSDDICAAVGAGDGSDALRAEAIVHAEIERLEQVFSIADDTSMLNQWINDSNVKTSNEFDELLSTALRWQRSSRGVFNVSTRRLRNLWERAAADGCQPSSGELHELAVEIADAPYRFDGHLLRQLDDCRGVDLRAIAKAFILDTASAAARRRCSLRSLTIGTFDKIVHCGSVEIEVSLWAMADRYGAPPAFMLRNGAVAVRLADHRVPGGRRNDIFDPRTGLRVSDGASVAVVAPDATTADAIATIVKVMTPAHGLDFVDALNSSGRARHPSEFLPDDPGAEIQCWILDTHGGMHYVGPPPKTASTPDCCVFDIIP